MTEADLRAEARQRLAVDKLLTTEVEPKAAVTEADIADFYKKNPQFFMQPEAMRASHILLKADTPEAKAAAKTKAEDLLQADQGRRRFRRARQAALQRRQRAQRRRPGLLPARPDGQGRSRTRRSR